MNGYLQDICGYLHISTNIVPASGTAYTNGWYILYHTKVQFVPCFGTTATKRWYSVYRLLVFSLFPLVISVIPSL